MKFRHAAAAITALLVMHAAAAQTAVPAKPASTPAPANAEAKPGGNPSTDPATAGMPKAETPARRGRSSVAGQATGSLSSLTCPADQFTRGEGSSTCRVRGICSLRSAMTVLMIPATPAAHCAWPMFDFTEPSHSGRSVRRWP